MAFLYVKKFYQECFQKEEISTDEEASRPPRKQFLSEKFHFS